MSDKERHFTLERFLVTLLVYQGIFWFLPHFSQAFAPLDDEDYMKGKGRIARSSFATCKFGWDEFGEKCYIAFGINSTERKPWYGANSHCRYLHSTLVSIHSREEQNYLNTKFSHSSDLRVWLGLYRSPYVTDLIWTDGSSLDFTNWNIGSQDTNPSRQFYGLEVCAQMQVSLDGKWTEGSCRDVLPYICQSFKGSNEGLFETFGSRGPRSFDNPFDESSGDGQGSFDNPFDESSGDGQDSSCSSETCHNGGVCVFSATVGNFQCICAEGFQGERCEQRRICTDDACKNGGSCVEDAETGDFQCNCMDGYNGERCEEEVSVPGIDISEYIYIISAVTVAVSLIIIVVVVVLLKRSRNRGKNANDNVASPSEETSITMSSCRRTQSQD